MVQQVDKAVLEKIINVVMIIDYDQGCDDHDVRKFFPRRSFGAQYLKS